MSMNNVSWVIIGGQVFVIKKKKKEVDVKLIFLKYVRHWFSVKAPI